MSTFVSLARIKSISLNNKLKSDNTILSWYWIYSSVLHLASPSTCYCITVHSTLIFTAKKKKFAMITSNSIRMNIWRGLFLDRIQHSFASDRITKKKFWGCKSSRGWSKENKQVWVGAQKNKDRKDNFSPNLSHKFFLRVQLY